MTPILAGGKEVAARTTLNAKNLEALGPERMAELLIEISNGNAAAKRRLTRIIHEAHGLCGLTAAS